MNDRITKLLMLLIAVGLLLNATATIYNALVTPAYAADSRIYLEGGRIEVTLARPVELRVDRSIPVSVDGSVKLDTFGAANTIKVKVEDTVQVRQTR